MTYICLSRRKFIASLFLLSMVSLGCLENEMKNELPPAIFQYWIHSREEDIETVRVYRPSDYEFPPSRGRDGFEFRENGEFIQYGIGPTDRLQRIRGTWTAEGENQIRVSFKADQQESYTIQVVSCDESLLKIRRDF